MVTKLDKRVESIESSQKKIISGQNKILKLLETTNKDEAQELKFQKKELKQENLISKEEEKELSQLQDIENLEKNIKAELKVHPLRKITFRDVTKGIIGAFFGIVSHFAFAEGAHISEEYSLGRSILLLLVSFFIIILFLYFSGFRNVKDKLVFSFLPIRAFVLYFSAIITVVCVLFLYDFVDLETPIAIIFNNVAAISVLAVLGAGAADLVGKGEADE